MMWHWGGGWGTGWMWLWMILWGVLWVALIGGFVYALVRVLGGLGGRDRTALRILEERFARGEITAEQLREMRRQLEGK